jgi:hypothetical protein
VTARGNLNMNKLSFLPLLPSLDAGLPIWIILTPK